MSKRKNTKPAPQANPARVAADQARRASNAGGFHTNRKPRSAVKRAALKEFA